VDPAGKAIEDVFNVVQVATGRFGTLAMAREVRCDGLVSRGPNFGTESIPVVVRASHAVNEQNGAAGTGAGIMDIGESLSRCGRHAVILSVFREQNPGARSFTQFVAMIGRALK
jgi:hypothetical protein